MKRSIRSYLVNGLLRITVKRRLCVKDDFAYMRAMVGRVDTLLAGRISGLDSTRTELDHTPCEIMRTAKSRDDRVLFYVHGGGFFLGILAAHRDLLSHWCDSMSCTAYVPDYRLSPEYSYPEPQEDVYRAYRALLDSGVAAEHLVVAGESAGACLSLNLLQRIHREQLPMPRCAILTSVAADMTVSGDSAVANIRKDPMFSMRSLLVIRNAHVRGPTIAEPGASPLFGDFTGLPPLKLFVGSTEILLSDSQRVADTARRAGIEADLEIWHGMPHAFPLMSVLPESRKAEQSACDFVARHAGWT